MWAEALCLPGLGLCQRKLRVHWRSVCTPVYFSQVQLPEGGEVYIYSAFSLLFEYLVAFREQ